MFSDLQYQLFHKQLMSIGGDLMTVLQALPVETTQLTLVC
jgi:hypothetical protein